MPARTRLARFAVAPAVLLAAAVGLAQPEKAPFPKEAAPKAGVKLPDGTFLWTGDAERVVLTPDELQKLTDQVEQLKKQLAARKPASPSGCAVKGKVEKRGEAVVAAFKVMYSFRTTAANAAVSLGGKRSFLVSAQLDGNKLPVLDTGDDGLVVLVEAAGDHALTVELEAPVSGRGTKTELGFELGLPRAAITTLALEVPPEVKRVNLATRTPEPGKAAETRRVPALDVKQLAARPGSEAGYALGPVESVEVTWEPPAAAAPSADVGQSAEIDVACVLTEGLVEATAKFRLRGTARDWKIVSPVEPVPERAPGADALPGTPPTITKPADPAKPVWGVTFPAGANPADWTLTAVVRQERPKPGDAKHRGPFAVGPFSVPGGVRQTGTVKVTAAANTRFTFAHGPELRRAEPPAPADEYASVGFFRLAPGPSPAAPAFEPLLRVEAEPMKGLVRVRPTYRLQLTNGGWQVRAELQVTPIRREVGEIAVEVPASWPRAIHATPETLVEGVLQDEPKPDAAWRTVTVKLARPQRQPFEFALTTTFPPVAPPARDASLPLIRFPDGMEADATVIAIVQSGLEVRGSAREWEGAQPATWASPLAPVPGPDGKVPKAVAAVQGKFDRGVSRVDLTWQPYRPELSADVRAEVTVSDRQAVVRQEVKLRSPDGFPRPVRFNGPASLSGAALEPVGPGEWSFAPPTDVKEAAFAVTFAVPLPPRAGGDRAAVKLPVGLLWPTGATRTESVVRVWSNAGGRAVVADLGAWRELPPEPVPDRDAMPAATLAGSGSDVPLVLELRDAVEPGAVAVWAERGLIQAWTGDDGTVTCRARFLLKRWLSDSIEVQLPGPVYGPAPELFLDDPPRKVNPAAVAETNGGADRVVVLPLPAAKPGRTLVLEVRYQLAAGRPGNGSLYVAPRPKAAFTGPVRWLIAVPAGGTPLAVGDGLAVEQRWRFHHGLFEPGPAASADDLDRWFRSGTEPGDTDAADDWPAGSGEPVVLRQTGTGSVRVYRVPTLGLVVGASVAVLLIGLVVSRIRGSIAGPVVALLGGAAAVAAVLFPQPAGQVAGAAEPGVLALALVLVAQVVARRYYRRRVTYLPGFTRTRPGPEEAPMPAMPSSGQAARNGSTGTPSLGSVPRPTGSGS